MAIQLRRGAYSDFDPDKMLPGELAVVTSGDPGADDGRSVYACFVAGDVKRMATYEDMEENIDQATQDIQEAFSAQLTQKISQADTAISQAQTATSAANTAAQEANEAKQEALDAAEAAESYILGDISNKTVTFSEASTRGNINTGESTSTLFGKIKKWFSDLGTAAFHAVANNLTTNTEGSVLDARQGKVLGDAINQLNTKIEPKSGEITFESGFSPSRQYLKKMGNFVQFFAVINATFQGNGSTKIGTLPSGFRPEMTVSIPITTSQSLNGVDAYANVTSDGSINVYQYEASSAWANINIIFWVP